MYRVYIYKIQYFNYKVNDRLLSGKSADITANEMVEPIYHFQEIEMFSDTPEVLDALKLLGHKSFRMKQEECIMRILSGKNTSCIIMF